MSKVIIKDEKITESEIEKLSIDYKLDFIAYYKLLKEAVYKILINSVENNLTAEETIRNIEKLFDDQGDEAKKEIIEKIRNFNQKIKK